MSDKTVACTMDLTEDTKDRVIMCAQLEGIKQSELVEKALRQYFAHSGYDKLKMVKS